MKYFFLLYVLILFILKCSCEENSKRTGTYQIPESGFPPYGVPSGSDGFPSYYERAILVWYNMVRLDPLSFKTTWLAPLVTDSSINNVFNTSAYPTTSAIPWNLNLNRAARAHCADRLTCLNSTVYAHDDCNGTTAEVRVSQFYTGWSGEIYWDYPYVNGQNIQNNTWPFFAVAGWICDGELYSNGFYTLCPIDSEAGHRQIIMTIGTEVGCGVAYQGEYALSTCDEGSSTPAYQPTIFSAAHIFNQADNSFQFFANYYNPSSQLTSAHVYVDGVEYDLSLQSGSVNAGTYQSQSFDFSTNCQSYFFKFIYSGGSEVYPFEGSFNTLGAGSCSTDYSPATSTSATSTSATSNSATSNSATSTTEMSTTGSSTKDHYPMIIIFVLIFLILIWRS